MPFIFKKKDSSKGVLIVKHFEYQLFKKLPARLIHEVRKDYYIGVYFGFACKACKEMKKYVDFVVATNNVAIGLDKKIPRINLNGFNFVSEPEDIFNSVDFEKKYDLIFVGNSQSRKNLLPYVNALLKLDKVNKNVSTVIINRVGRSLEQKVNAFLIRKVMKGFSEEFLKGITYIELDGTTTGIPKNCVHLLFKQSKALILPSRSEGAARVVAEACLNNLNIISYSKMAGGSNNYLSPEFDVLFDDFKVLPQVITEFIEKYETHYSTKVSDTSMYLEVNSKKVFTEELTKITGEDLQLYNEICDNTNMKNALSAHNNILPAKHTNRQSDEILTFFKMLLFCSSLINKKVTLKDCIYYKANDLKMLARRKLLSIIYVVKPFISR